jgi:hypothetical protein
MTTLMQADIRLTSMALGLGLLLCASSCGAVIFDESIDGQEIVRDVDDRFAISLPLAIGDLKIDRSSPEIVGNAVRLLKRELDAKERRDIFRFEAVAPGEVEIRWWRLDGAGRRLAPDCAVKVKVRLADW